jgi:hypothetical protein
LDTFFARHCEERSNLFQYFVILSGAKDLFFNKHGVYPLLAAGGPVTFFVVVCFFKVLKMASPFVATKVTKKASPEMLLCRTRPLPCKAGRTTGCNYFALLRSRNPELQQKLAMPLQPHRPPSFYPLSPEAYLLTRKKEIPGILKSNKSWFRQYPLSSEAYLLTEKGKRLFPINNSLNH